MPQTRPAIGEICSNRPSSDRPTQSDLAMLLKLQLPRVVNNTLSLQYTAPLAPPPMTGTLDGLVSGVGFPPRQEGAYIPCQ